MNPLSIKQIFRTAAISVVLVAASSAGAQTVLAVSTFATGTAVNATSPDSIALWKNSVWVSYSNGADSTGLSGNSTVVQYKLNGKIRHIYSIPGYVDGLKVDPRSGLVWAMQNQDGNSTLTLINPKAGTASAPISYAVTSGARGYDDVAFRFNQAFVSYTNPTGPTDPTIQLVQNGSNPVVVTPILLMGATGTNLATGQANQPTAQNDPDSLKLIPNGDLMLSSDADSQLIFVGQPGTMKQSVSFLTLLDPSTGLAVSGVDDAVFATADKGSFYLSDTNNNQILKIDAANLAIGSLYASLGGLNEFATVDIHTGLVTALVSNLNAPHGLEFSPNTEDSQGDNTNQ
jgi:hypothetical protein